MTVGCMIPANVMRFILPIVALALMGACGGGGGASSHSAKQLTAAGLTPDYQLVLSGVTISANDYLAFVHDDRALTWPAWCQATYRTEPLALFVQGVRVAILNRGVSVTDDAVAVGVNETVHGALVGSEYLGSPSDIQRATKLATSIRC